VARAAPDGNTILMSATAEVVINQHFMSKMLYQPERDLKPVTLTVKLPFVLVAEPSKPFSDMASLIAYARKNPGKSATPHREPARLNIWQVCCWRNSRAYSCCMFRSRAWHKR
jgi:tripartite-type tricarboxylate transporter receptor subunit TctC